MFPTNMPGSGRREIGISRWVANTAGDAFVRMPGEDGEDGDSGRESVGGEEAKATVNEGMATSLDECFGEWDGLVAERAYSLGNKGPPNHSWGSKLRNYRSAQPEQVLLSVCISLVARGLETQGGWTPYIGE